MLTKRIRGFIADAGWKDPDARRGPGPRRASDGGQGKRVTVRVYVYANGSVMLGYPKQKARPFGRVTGSTAARVMQQLFEDGWRRAKAKANRRRRT